MCKSNGKNNTSPVTTTLTVGSGACAFPQRKNLPVVPEGEGHCRRATGHLPRGREPGPSALSFRQTLVINQESKDNPSLGQERAKAQSVTGPVCGAYISRKCLKSLPSEPCSPSPVPHSWMLTKAGAHPIALIPSSWHSRSSKHLEAFGTPTWHTWVACSLSTASVPSALSSHRQ